MYDRQAQNNKVINCSDWEELYLRKIGFLISLKQVWEIHEGIRNNRVKKNG